jgi:putative tryptophan/tyrosine transport system substrate-binding protein
MMIARRWFAKRLPLAIAALPSVVRAQQARHTIGFLRVGKPPASFVDGFLQGLREARREGPNLAIEYGIASTAFDLPKIARELLQRNISVMIASGTPSVVPAKNATTTVPVVFVAAVDPVAAGVVKSLAHPGGNVTGVTAMHADLVAKRIALVKELLPRVSRVAVLARATSPASAQYVKEAEAAAPKLGIQLHVLTVFNIDEIESAFAGMRDVSAVIVSDDAVFTAHRNEIAHAAVKNRLPTMYGFSEMVDAGGLLAYGPHYGDMYRRAALQVHKLLNGVKPAELPVEQPVKFELVVNMKTARALGLVIPQAVMLRTDQIIE